MWESFYDRTSQSCSGINAKLSSHNKKKTDLLSVEYLNYIHKDILCCLDPYPMKNSKNKPNQKKGAPNSRRRDKGNLIDTYYYRVNEEAGYTKKRSKTASSCKRCDTTNELKALSEKICDLLPNSLIPPQKTTRCSKLPPCTLSNSQKELPIELQKTEEQRVEISPIIKPILKQLTERVCSIERDLCKDNLCADTIRLRNKSCTEKTCPSKNKFVLIEEDGSKQIFTFGEKGSGTRTHGGEVQDFYQIRDDCLANGTLFEDPEFPCTDSSLFFSQRPDRHYEWKRPHELCDDPKFFVEGFSRFDVQQGILGDCWLLAATANLTLHSRLFFQVVPDDQEFDEKYAGIFHFRFWQYGKWIDIVIDDRLPTYRGELVFLHSTEENEFWSALMEKAYAKLNGSYEALKGGSTCEAMEDFTGGVTEMYEMDSSPPNLFQIVMKAFERNSLMGCSIEPDPNVLEAHTPQGLIRGHAYSITRVKYVQIHTPNVSGKIPLLRLRNPWGNEDEWNGAWSDNAPEWRYISPDEKEELGLTFDSDGEFWISFKDFMKYFSRLEICNLNPDSLSEDELQEGNKKKWEMSVFEGEWVRGVTAGGCRNHLASFWHNPQYRITLTDVDEDDDDNKCTMIVALMQKNRRLLRQSGAELLTVGFAIYHLSYPDRLPRPLDLNFFKYNASVARSPSFVNLREVSCRFKLPPGTYCIVPSTFDPNEEGEFILRVFTEKANVMEEHDEEVGFGEVAPAANTEPTEEEKQEFDQIYEFFSKLAGEDKEVDWMELKDILDFSLKSDREQKKIISTEPKKVEKDPNDGKLLTPQYDLKVEKEFTSEADLRAAIPPEIPRKEVAQTNNTSNSLDSFCSVFCVPLMGLFKPPPEVAPLRTALSELKLQGFSKDICRSMVAMLDADRSGKLGFQEFKELWNSIRQWKSVWLLYDKDKSGTFSGFELREALNAAGFKLNNKILNILMHRYGNKNGEMEFEDFMMCTIKLKTMMELFQKKEPTGTTKASFSLDEWLENTLYS